MYRELELKDNRGKTRIVPFLSTGTTAIRFKEIFRKDLLASLTKMGAYSKEKKSEISTVLQIAESGEMETISELAYIMNSAAEKADFKLLSFEKFVDWADQFESMELLYNANKIMEIYLASRITSSEIKKNSVQQTAQ